MFNTNLTGYNSTASPIQATVNIGPVHLPKHKGRIPQYPCNQLEELHAKYNELE